MTASYLIYGIISIEGVVQSGNSITVRNDTRSEEAVVTSQTDGSYVVDLADPKFFAVEYQNGDSIKVTYFTSTKTTTVADKGTSMGEQININIPIRTYNIDTLLQLTVPQEYLVDSVFKKTGFVPFIVDLLLNEVAVPKEFLLDVLLQETEKTREYILDLLFEGTDVLTYNLDASFQKLDKSKQYTLDTLLKQTGTSQLYKLDVAMLQATIIKAYLLDALLKTYNATKPYILDAFFSETGMTSKTVSYLLDTLLKKLNSTKPYMVDTVIAEVKSASYIIDVIFNITKPYLLDVWICEEKSKSYILDVFFQGLQCAITYTIDLLCQQTGATKNYILDALHQLAVSRNYKVDSLLRKTQPISLLLDAFFQGEPTEGHFHSEDFNSDDFYTGDVNSRAKEYLLDFLIKAEGIFSSPYLLDAVFVLPQAKTYVLDVFFKALATYSMTYAIDVLLKKITESASYKLDVVFGGLSYGYGITCTSREVKSITADSSQVLAISATATIEVD